ARFHPAGVILHLLDQSFPTGGAEGRFGPFDISIVNALLVVADPAWRRGHFAGFIGVRQVGKLATQLPVTPLQTIRIPTDQDRDRPADALLGLHQDRRDRAVQAVGEGLADRPLLSLGAVAVP